MPAEEAERTLKKRTRNNERYNKIKKAGGEDAYRELRQKERQQEKEAARARALLRQKERQQEKEAARARARAQALLRKEQMEQQGEQWARDMAAKVRATLAQQGMMQKCLESIKGGSQEVQDWAQVVRKHGKTGSNKQFCYVDIEGRAGDECPPYSVSVVAANYEKT